MTAKRIPQLDAITGASTANDDNLVIFDTSTNTTKRILRSQLAAGLVNDLPYAASSGSSLVGYLPAGSGAVATTVQAKLREIVSVKDFGADPSGVADSTAAIQAAIDARQTAGGGTVYLPAGTYKVTQIDLKPTVNILGDGITSTIIDGQGAVDTIITDGKLFEQSFTNFTVTHANNSVGSGIKLIHLLDGANGCLFDVRLIGKPSITDGGFWLRGKNPNTGIANNNQYNNTISVRALSSAGDISGTAIWLYGENLTNARANANTIQEGTVVTNWSQGVTVRGSLNKFYGLQLNPCSVHGIKFELDATGETTENTLFGTGFDDTWSTSKVVATSNVDDFVCPAVFYGSAIDLSDISLTGTFAAKLSIGLIGSRGIVVPSDNDTSSLNAQLNGGIYRSNNTGVFVVQGGSSTLNSKLVAAGTSFAGNQTVSAGGASFMLPTSVTSEFRIVSTVDGTTGVQLFAFTLDGRLRWGVDGADSVVITKGAGSPQGVVTARPGSLYMNTSGGAGTTLYVKESGTGDTGWVAK